MERLLGICMLLLFFIQPVSGSYYESAQYITDDGTEYYYTSNLSYLTYYYGETIYLDTELVVDLFGYDSYSFYDIEMFIAGEDSAGFTIFEDSHFTGLDIIDDQESVVVEWDIFVGDDFPSELSLYVAADFYEETIYGDFLYEEDWIFITTISIYDGSRNRSTPFELSPIVYTLIFVSLVVVPKYKTRIQS